MEVLLRSFEVRSGEEIGPDTRWAADIGARRGGRSGGRPLRVSIRPGRRWVEVGKLRMHDDQGSSALFPIRSAVSVVVATNPGRLRSFAAIGPWLA